MKYSGAVIGCGRMGCFTSTTILDGALPFWLPLSHAEAIDMHPMIELAALVDSNRASLVKAAQKYSQARSYETLDKLFQNEKVDLVSIATRTPGRAEIIKACIDEKIHALHIEKPLCNSVAELNELEKIFSRREIFITYGALRRYFDIYIHALNIADSGVYGKLREIRVNFGAAPLYWTHAHSVDLILFAAKDRRVVGVQGALGNIECKDSKTHILNDPNVMVASIYFDDGLVGSFTQALGSDLVLSCEFAEISVRADGERLEVYEKGRDRFPDARPLIYNSAKIGPSGTLAPISQIVECMSGRATAIRENEIIKKAIICGQRIMFGIVQSHLNESKIIQLDSIDESIVIEAMIEGRPA